MSALEKGNVHKAREAFERSLSALPSFPEGHLGLGHLAMRDRRFDDALREFRSAETGYKAMSATMAQMETDRYARSRDDLARARAELAELESNARRAQNASTIGASEGQLMRLRTQLEARIRVLESMNPPIATAVRDAPAEILFFQGNALFDLKRNDEAIAAWESALRRDPKQPLAENNLAVAYWMAGRFAEAQAAMRRSELLGFKVNPSFRADLERSIASNQ
jgi:tetratricopeptide (TPR) repeat protein